MLGRGGDMGRYRYKIENNTGKYFFALYPNNIPNQEVGRSIEYADENQCGEALKEFKNFVSQNRLDSYAKTEYVNIYEDGGKFYYEIVCKGKTLFYRKNGYNQKKSAEKIIASIYKHINAPLV
jgi:hypothetical protein